MSGLLMQSSTRAFWRTLLCVYVVAGAVDAARAQDAPVSQIAPAPSQVEPPSLPNVPQAARQIPGVTPPEAPAFPQDADKLSFELLGFDIVGEFDEFVAVRRELAAPLIGKRVTVADVFNFATKLQAAYVGAGYLLARVVVAPQELNEKARVKIQVIDGFIERLEVEALPAFVRGRVAAVLQPLVNKRRLLQRELERRLLLAGDTPGLDLRSTFAAGEQIGGSVLILTGPYRAITASAYIDNAMPRVYGTTQTVALLGFNSVLGLGEQISVSATGLPVRNFGTEFPTRRFVQAALQCRLGSMA
jgi:hemolysin activation/secretion protein